MISNENLIHCIGYCKISVYTTALDIIHVSQFSLNIKIYFTNCFTEKHPLVIHLETKQYDALI